MVAGVLTAGVVRAGAAAPPDPDPDLGPGLSAGAAAPVELGGVVSKEQAGKGDGVDGAPVEEPVRELVG